MERLFGGLPFTKDGIESSRVQQLSTACFAHLEQVDSQLALVNGMVRVSWPFEWFQDDSVETKPFLVGISGVVIIHAKRARCSSAKHAEEQQERYSTDDSFHAKPPSCP